MVSLHEAFSRTLFEFQISGAELARASGVSERQISNFKKGKIGLNSKNLQKVLMAMRPDARRYFLSLAFDLILDLPETADTSPLVRFIRAWQKQNNVSDVELRLLITTRTRLPIEKFNEIMQGRPATENELGYIGGILPDSEGKLYPFEYLQAIRDGKAPGDESQGHKENGNCGSTSH